MPSQAVLIFVSPIRFSSDKSGDLDCFDHFYKWVQAFGENELGRRSFINSSKDDFMKDFNHIFSGLFLLSGKAGEPFQAPSRFRQHSIFNVRNYISIATMT